NRLWSLDARRTTVVPSPLIPSWCIFLLRFQLAVVYVFAGLAKINADWLRDAEPMRLWLAARSDLPVVGGLFLLPGVATAASWAGAAFDLSIVPLLVWRRTRAFAYVLVVLFHAATALLFPIGIFPWLMIAATTIFFSSSWPRRLLPQAVRGEIPM